MSKLQQIVTYLESEKLDVAVVSDPVTINYLTGFYSDPHERQMFLFVLADQEPLLFVPALEVERATSTVSFPVVGYVDSENPWKKIKENLPAGSFRKITVEFDNLIYFCHSITFFLCSIFAKNRAKSKGRMITFLILQRFYQLSKFFL